MLQYTLPLASIRIKQGLLKRWYLDKYKIANKAYPPSRVEKDDYILFKEDMTFISRSEGKMEEGSWSFNTNGSYIEMLDGTGEKVKAYVITITANLLILRFDVEEIRDMQAIYQAH
ncbi:lipocalin family protein [Fulvivirga sp. M361]|uniref:lipocalin family protein n=1 Tax=Fulvivirga sp. M361 TaxID=2594266 RepID=UPI00117BC684|nr:lipocalin family protein [Fulvivirga sp. M361]TRX57728.1 lipocalin family protein [Fulvivirga sp. M361]